MGELAERQHGLVAHGQLAALGLPPGTIQSWVQAGRLQPVHRGVFAVGHRSLSPRGWWMAAVLRFWPDGVLSHASAAALWDLRPSAAAVIDVTTTLRTRHGAPQIRLHRTRRLHEADRTHVQAIPVTTIPRLLLDLAEVLPVPATERVLNEAERRGLLDVHQIRLAMARGRGRHGLKPLRRLLGDRREPVFTRSELEDQFLGLCRSAGIPLPQTNAVVEGLEVDALWPAACLVVELDGFAFHSDRATFERDRERDQVLQLAGYRVLRFTARRLRRHPEAVTAAVRAGLAPKPSGRAGAG